MKAAVDSASRAMGNHQSIEFFEAYLLKSVDSGVHSPPPEKPTRRVCGNADLERLAGAVSTDVERQLDDAKRIEVFRACMDEQGRAMYDLRVLDYDWRWIARLTGYADAHSAEVQFHKKCDKALERFRAHHDSRLKPQSSE